MTLVDRQQSHSLGLNHDLPEQVYQKPPSQLGSGETDVT